jgi:hypothetical protein
MMADLSKGSRLALSSLIKTDKNNLALLSNFAIRADGQLNRDEIIQKTSFALQHPIRRETADQLIDALLESGWIVQN